MHSIREFASEALEGVTHADSRLWRTLWLLISKPGFLTVEFLEGRRARYLPPFRLYLVLSVVLFLVAASVNHHATLIRIGPADDDTTATGDAKPKANEVAVEVLKATETSSARAHRICDDIEFDVGPASWEPRVKAGCYKMALDGGESFIEAFYHNVPRALFVLLPLLALVMRAMYWRRYYVEHLLFFLHNHAFTFVLFTLFALGMAVTSWSWLIWFYALLVLLYPPIYTYKAMRRVYAQGRWITSLKFLALATAYLLSLFALAIFIGLYSLLTL